MTVTDEIKMVVAHDSQERQPITAVWRNGGFSASYDIFVVDSIPVLLFKLCYKNSPLHQTETLAFISINIKLCSKSFNNNIC